MMNGKDGNRDDSLMTRVTLINRAKNQQDEGAWADFNRCYRQYLYQIVRKTGLPHTSAEDVVQNSLIRIWGALPKFEYNSERGHFRSWLCKIAINAARNYLRDEGREPSSVRGDESESGGIESLAVTSETDELAEREWQAYLPELALKNIRGFFDGKTIQAYLLYRNNVPVKQIAERLGIAESSVYVYRKRVADRLRDEVKRLQSEL